jgi:hypothetical protein
MSIKQRTRLVAEALPPGRISATDLHLAFRRAFPDDTTSQNLVGLAFRAAGLLSGRTTSGRYWVRPDELPPVDPASEPKTRTPQPPRSCLVSLQCLGLQPGDGFVIAHAPAAITIRKATPGIELTPLAPGTTLEPRFTGVLRKDLTE